MAISLPYLRLVHESKSQTGLSSASLAHKNCVSLAWLCEHLNKFRKLAIAAVEYLRHRTKVEGLLRILRYLGNEWVTEYTHRQTEGVHPEYPH